MLETYNFMEMKKCREPGSKREIILLSAFDLFYRKGYHKTKVLDIAKQADIGKGTFYEYFPSKEALLSELLLLKIEGDQSHLEQITGTAESVKEKIKTFYRFEQENIQEYGPRSNVLAQEMMSPDFTGNREIQELIHKLFKLKHQFLQHLMEVGIQSGEIKKTDPVVAATALLGAISFYTMFQIPAMGHPGVPSDSEGNFEVRDQEFFRILFSGIGPVSDNEKG